MLARFAKALKKPQKIVGIFIPGKAVWPEAQYFAAEPQGLHVVEFRRQQRFENLAQACSRKDQGVAAGIRSVTFEGGEPFLFHPLLVAAVRQAGERGLSCDLVTNCYWATSVPDAELWLAPLQEAGLGSLSLSDDAFHGSDGEWVAWTPEGYYTSSLNGDRYVGWHINRGEGRSALYYPASRFAKQFRSRRIVAAYLDTSGDLEEAIRLANIDQPRRTQKRMVTDLGSLVPPAVVVYEPSSRDVTVHDDPSNSFWGLRRIVKSITH